MDSLYKYDPETYRVNIVHSTRLNNKLETLYARYPKSIKQRKSWNRLCRAALLSIRNLSENELKTLIADLEATMVPTRESDNDNTIYNQAIEDNRHFKVSTQFSLNRAFSLLIRWYCLDYALKFGIHLTPKAYLSLSLLNICSTNDEELAILIEASTDFELTQVKTFKN